ncbi:LLM class flavin-dependent oxidoreductase [Nonomuraea sp. NPDC050643]|uniref:LLM class flavin-dependent oxidoreductase n=1 Tax=Nonomuraea sp. NPDC050643 TaxID=3155660 RepID=UPI0033C2AD7C
MDIGVALPTVIPGTRAGQLLDWARRADRLGFSTLGTLDRLVYDSLEPLTTLAAAAAVTERITLATTILIATYRADVAVLAKQAATVDRLSEGRLVLGLAAGLREDDFTANGTGLADRGRRLDAMAERLLRIWSGAPEDGYDRPIGPVPERAPRLLFGGHSEAAMRRAGRHGWGWITGGGAPSGYAIHLERARAVWREEGRADEPRKLALSYFVLGTGAPDHAARFLGDYYAFLGPGYAGRAAAGAITDEARLGEVVTGYRDAGCDELIFVPCLPDPGQLDLLAKAVL